MSQIDTPNYKEWAAEQARSKADKKYPLAWFQKGSVQNVILVVIGTVITAYQFYVGWGNVPSWFTFSGMGAFLIGWLADILTTDQAFGYLPEYQKRGLVYPIIERNPYLSDYPSVKEQLINPSSVIKLAALLLAPLFPALGWGGAWSAFSAAFNNRRNRDAVLFQLRQYDVLVNRQKKEEMPEGISYSDRIGINDPGHRHRILAS